MGATSPRIVPITFGYQPSPPPNDKVKSFDFEAPPWSPNGPGCFWWLLLALVACVMLVTITPGCYDAPPKTYVVRLVRPDGKSHREYRVRGRLRPWITGQAVWGVSVSGSNVAPEGWLWEVDETAEQEDGE